MNENEHDNETTIEEATKDFADRLIELEQKQSEVEARDNARVLDCASFLKERCSYNVGMVLHHILEAPSGPAFAECFPSLDLIAAREFLSREIKRQGGPARQCDSVVIVRNRVTGVVERMSIDGHDIDDAKVVVVEEE